MKILDLSVKFGFEVVFSAEGTTALVDAYTSDLLSDVMAKAGEGSVLITIQAHKNTIAVASLIGMRAIVICNERPVPSDMVQAARDEGIAIFRTAKNQFEVSGLLYRALRG